MPDKYILNFWREKKRWEVLVIKRMFPLGLKLMTTHKMMTNGLKHCGSNVTWPQYDLHLCSCDTPDTINNSHTNWWFHWVEGGGTEKDSFLTALTSRAWSSWYRTSSKNCNQKIKREISEKGYTAIIFHMAWRDLFTQYFSTWNGIGVLAILRVIFLAKIVLFKNKKNVRILMFYILFKKNIKKFVRVWEA